MVIEDDMDMTFILNMALTSKYIVRINNDAQDLLETLDEFMPDLVLTDYSIGVEKGGEIIKKIRRLERFKMLPVILFTGHPEIKKLSLEIHAIAYLSKPFDLVDLYACLDKALLKIANQKVLVSPF